MTAAGSAVPLYNGNISQTSWRTESADKQKRGYGYRYDDLNRLKQAVSRLGGSLSTWTYGNVNSITYDQNGNILSLYRDGFGDGSGSVEWDDLDYVYDGNQLKKVTDHAASGVSHFGFNDGANMTTEYVYDANGNMTIDRNKGITSITYNHLNLPVEVVFNNNPSTKIEYVYDAAGVKLKKIVHDSGTSEILYAGNFMYKTENNNTSLEFFSHPEGYVVPVESSQSVKGFTKGSGQTTYSSYSCVFQYKDHLGNVRLSYSDSNKDGSVSTSEIIEESNYYPFGLKHKGYNNVVAGGNDLAQNWKYGGKELNSELSLELYDFGARNYDAALARWMNIDPLSEQMRRHSPYNYAFDNPIFYVDPDGKSPFGFGGIVSWYGQTNGISEGSDKENYNSFNDPETEGDNTNDNVSLKSETENCCPDENDDPIGFLMMMIKTWFNPEVKSDSEYDARVASGEMMDKLEETSIKAAEVNYTVFLETATAPLGLGKVTGFKELFRAARLSKTGGLNLFKWGAKQTSKSKGWKTGDYFLHLPDKGSPKLNWKANYGALRREMGKGNPIFDSYKLPNGNLIPTGGFLNAERYILKTRGWNYYRNLGAWIPPR